MAAAQSVKPPPTAMAASISPSAIVEQAPYSPTWGMPVFLRQKEELMHWFSRSPENTMPSRAGSRSAFFSSSFRVSRCMVCSACSKVFSPQKLSGQVMSKLFPRGPSVSFFPAALAQAVITGGFPKRKLCRPIF